MDLTHRPRFPSLSRRRVEQRELSDKLRAAEERAAQAEQEQLRIADDYDKRRLLRPLLDVLDDCVRESGAGGGDDEGKK